MPRSSPVNWNQFTMQIIIITSHAFSDLFLWNPPKHTHYIVPVLLPAPPPPPPPTPKQCQGLPLLTEINLQCKLLLLQCKSCIFRPVSVDPPPPHTHTLHSSCPPPPPPPTMPRSSPVNWNQFRTQVMHFQTSFCGLRPPRLPRKIHLSSRNRYMSPTCTQPGKAAQSTQR